uniref:Uncharacterized protein n=1 Tax=Alloyangia mangrovi TaxID=1779329 RepID=A0A2A3JRP7_9RHOB
MMVIDPFRFVLTCCFLPAPNGRLAQLLRRGRAEPDRAARRGRLAGPFGPNRESWHKSAQPPEPNRLRSPSEGGELPEPARIAP